MSTLDPHLFRPLRESPRLTGDHGIAIGASIARAGRGPRRWMVNLTFNVPGAAHAMDRPPLEHIVVLAVLEPGARPLTTRLPRAVLDARPPRPVLDGYINLDLRELLGLEGHRGPITLVASLLEWTSPAVRAEL